MVGMEQSVYALLADGTTVQIRPARPADFDAVKVMHQALSPDNSYLRFFNLSRLAAEAEARRVCLDPAPGKVALLALCDGEVVGVASYAGDPERPGQAEVAFAVADQMHHRGVATLLLEHLVSFARSHQVATFTAQTLTENKAMLNVFASGRAFCPSASVRRTAVIEDCSYACRARTAAPPWTATWTRWRSGSAARAPPACGTCSRPSRWW